MEGNAVSVEELKQAMAADFDRLAGEVAQAMNAAKEGRIIADVEEWVRQANAVFREQLYEKAIRLLQNKQEAFSPSAHRAQEQGPTADTHLTVNGRLCVRRTVYWSPQNGTFVPAERSRDEGGDESGRSVGAPVTDGGLLHQFRVPGEARWGHGRRERPVPDRHGRTDERYRKTRGGLGQALHSRT